VSEIVVNIEDVWKIFGPETEVERVLEAVTTRGLGKAGVLQEFGCVVGVAGASFSVARGEIFCIMGLSGSGKSTLVRHVNRLIEPTAGRIEILGRDVARMSPKDLREVRAKQIGMVFQHMALMPHRSVRDNVGYPLEIRGEPKSRRWAVSEHALSLVELRGFEDRLPKELSGGMQQRVGIARALASDPEILLMDEPFSALDPLIRRQLQNQFKALVDQLQKTTLFITHDLDEAIRLGSRIAIMKDGAIVQIGTPEEIVTQPADDYVREFVQDISKLKLVKAHSIMGPLDEAEGDLNVAPRAAGDSDLDHLIDLSVGSALPIVITDAQGQDIGLVSKARLLRGIQGGKD